MRLATTLRFCLAAAAVLLPGISMASAGDDLEKARALLKQHEIREAVIYWEFDWNKGPQHVRATSIRFYDVETDQFDEAHRVDVTAIEARVESLLLPTVKTFLDSNVPREMAGDDLAHAQGSVSQVFTTSTGKSEYVGPWVEDDSQGPLFRACESGKTDEVLALVAAGTDVNRPDQHGFTPLDAAIAYGHTEIVKVLLESGADPKIRSKIGATALMIAAGNRQASIVGLLLNSEQKIDEQDNDGNTAVMYAAENLFPTEHDPLAVRDILRRLKAAGASLDLRNKSQQTALMKAAASSNVAAVETLLDMGADASLRDSAGRDALVLAKAAQPSYERDQTVRFLEARQ